MSPRTRPDRNCTGELGVERAPRVAIGLIRSEKRRDDVVLRDTADMGNAAQDAIDFPVRAVAVEIQVRQSRGLRQQLLVRHHHAHSLQPAEINPSTSNMSGKRHFYECRYPAALYSKMELATCSRFAGITRVSVGMTGDLQPMAGAS